MSMYIPQQGKRDKNKYARVNWRTRNGTIITVGEMDDNHLISALQILERMADEYLKDQMSAVGTYWMRYQGEEAQRYLESALDEFSEGQCDIRIYLYEKDVRYWAMVEVLRERGINYLELAYLQIANEVLAPQQQPQLTAPEIPFPVVEDKTRG